MASQYFTSITNALIALMQSIKVENAPAFVNVVNAPVWQYDGYPSASVSPSDNTSDYSDIATNLRTYSHFIDVYLMIQDPTDKNAVQSAYNNASILVDLVTDAIDQSNTLSNLPGVDIIMPQASAWQLIETDASVILQARVVTRCKVLVSQNNG